ncbi:hypothetical protein AB0L41_25640 [Amycolatopsis mediterranei]|uniref:hypothetical protein n=1 Tax=Amycolatopsis mediterranei TaxID=33910 RepID=UPI00342574D0
MTTRIEMDLPAGDGNFPFEKLDQFVVHCKNMGAEEETKVTVVGATQDPSIATGLRVEFEKAARYSSCVEVRRDTVDDLVQLLEFIELSEFDARKAEMQISKLKQALIESVVYP